ncbi:MAG: hypothetical protein L6R40_003444 [Gallowayella cf. fulva]|nr:MAG: hypothetical protein L6R40_003444 [Xanthomendoza cf. fulva]
METTESAPLDEHSRLANTKDPVTGLHHDAEKESHGEDATSGSASPRTIHGMKWLLVVVAILSSILLYALDTTITADVIPNVIDDLGQASKLAWLSVGFLIGGVSGVLPICKLFGLFNAKYLYIGSIILFMAGSALCGAAPTTEAFIVGRVIAGLGGNGMYMGTLTLLSVTTNDKERPMYIGLTGLVFGTGIVCGPIVGGAFAESSATWRWGFYLNLVVGGLFAPVYIFLLPSFDPRAGQDMVSRIRGFDLVGAVLSIGVMVCTIMAINFGGALYSWDSGPIISLFVVAGVLLIVFFLQQRFAIFTQSSNRIFPTHFLLSKEAILLFILGCAANAGGYVPLYYIPIYFQFTRGNAALEAAVRLLPLVFLFSSTVIVNGAVMSKYGAYQPWYMVGSILLIIGGALSSLITTTTSTASIYGYEVLMGIGAGCQAQTGYAVLQALVDPTQVSEALGFMMLAQLLGTTLGLSIAGTVFVNRSIQALRKVLPDASSTQLYRAITGTSGGFFAGLSPDMRFAATRVIVSSIQRL